VPVSGVVSRQKWFVPSVDGEVFAHLEARVSLRDLAEFSDVRT
jgi:hypothetical protein